MRTALLTLASLALAVPTARADVVPRDLCHARTTDVLVQIDVKFDAQSTLVVAADSIALEPTKLIVLENGAWTFEKYDISGRSLKKAVGCLPPDRVVSLRTELAAAHWKEVGPPGMCDGMTPRFVEYRSHGDLVYTARACQRALDDKSQLALDHLTTVAGEITLPGGAPTPSTPAVPMFRPRTNCEATGPVLVEVDKIKTGSTDKQVTTIFASGGWSSSDHAPNEQTGCVLDPDFHALRDALAKATWKITKARFKCQAMSLIHTDYLVKGQRVWTEKLCSGETLDADSAAAVAALDALVVKLVPGRGPLQ